MRALAIALFFAIGTAIGGLGGARALFGWLIASGNSHLLVFGYLTGAGLMLMAAVVELFLGPAATKIVRRSRCRSRQRASKSKFERTCHFAALSGRSPEI